MMYSSSSCTSEKLLFPFRNGMKLHEPEFENLFKEPWNRFPTWRPGTTTIFDVPARQATQAGGIDSWDPLNVYKFGL